jgi:hypothetical protein
MPAPAERQRPWSRSPLTEITAIITDASARHVVDGHHRHVLESGLLYLGSRRVPDSKRDRSRQHEFRLFWSGIHIVHLFYVELMPICVQAKSLISHGVRPE